MKITKRDAEVIALNQGRLDGFHCSDRGGYSRYKRGGRCWHAYQHGFVQGAQARAIASLYAQEIKDVQKPV